MILQDCKINWSFYNTVVNSTGISEINVGGLGRKPILLQTDAALVYSFQTGATSASLGKFLSVEKIVSNDPEVCNPLLGRFTVATREQLARFVPNMPFQIEDISDANAVLGSAIVSQYVSRRGYGPSSDPSNAFEFCAILSSDFFASIAVGASAGDEAHPLDPNITAGRGVFLRPDTDQIVIVPNYANQQGRIVFQKVSGNARLNISVGHDA